MSTKVDKCSTFKSRFPGSTQTALHRLPIPGKSLHALRRALRMTGYLLNDQAMQNVPSIAQVSFSRQAVKDLLESGFLHRSLFHSRNLSAADAECLLGDIRVAGCRLRRHP